MSDDKSAEISKLRHGRAPKEYVNTLRKLSRKDYKAMERACVEAYFSKQMSVIIAASHLTKFPKGFPNKNLVRQEGRVDYWRVNARSLLKWLNRTGKSDITPIQMRYTLLSFNVTTRDIFNELEIDLH